MGRQNFMWQRKNIRLPLVGREAVTQRVMKETLEQAGGVELDTWCIMPNHVHAILVFRNSTMALGELLRRFKAKTSYLFGGPIWQANYYEHIIRHDQALGKIRAYIMNNPENEIHASGRFY